MHIDGGSTVAAAHTLSCLDLTLSIRWRRNSIVLDQKHPLRPSYPTSTTHPIPPVSNLRPSLNHKEEEITPRHTCQPRNQGVTRLVLLTLVHLALVMSSAFILTLEKFVQGIERYMGYTPDVSDRGFLDAGLVVRDVSGAWFVAVRAGRQLLRVAEGDAVGCVVGVGGLRPELTSLLILCELTDQLADLSELHCVLFRVWIEKL